MTGDARRVGVGIVGLGDLGSAIAEVLLAAGHPVRGHRRDPATHPAFAATGGTPVSSVAEVASGAGVIVLCLDSAATLDAVLGELVPALEPGTVVVETGTLPVAAKLRAREQVATAGADLVDAPVSGTAAMVRSGSATVFAAGPPAAVATVAEVLAAVGTVRRVGDVGDGARLKLVANLLVALHTAAAAEALVLAERLGLDPGTVMEALRDGPADSSVLAVRGPRMAAADYEPPRGTVGGLGADLRLIRDAATAAGAPTPLLATVAERFDAASAAGDGDRDTAVLVEVWRRHPHDQLPTQVVPLGE